MKNTMKHILKVIICIGVFPLVFVLNLQAKVKSEVEGSERVTQELVNPPFGANVTQSLVERAKNNFSSCTPPL